MKSTFDKSNKMGTILLVGAPRFELGTSCAQGRRATRLRYAPTVTSILAYFCWFPAALRAALFVALSSKFLWSSLFSRRVGLPFAFGEAVR